MKDLNNLIARQEIRCEQFIIHVRENRNAAAIDRKNLLALLEDLAKLKGERQRLEEEMELELAA